MGKRVISLILVLCLTLSLLPAADGLNVKFPSYTPYEKNEFPVWSQKLRRAEALFFGSLAITFPVSVGAYSLTTTYFPVPVPEANSTQVLQQAAIACGISVLIVLIDYIIGEIRD